MKNLLIFFLILLTAGCSDPYIVEVVDIDSFSCAKIGLERVKELALNYKTPTKPVEEKWIEEGNFDRLFLHNTKYALKMAKRYKLQWIPEHEMVDSCIVGLRKGLEKYLLEKRDFRAMQYAIHWTEWHCLRFMVKSMRNLHFPRSNGITEEEIDELKQRILSAEPADMNDVRKELNYVFETIDEKYQNFEVTLSNSEKDALIKAAAKGEYTIKAFEEDQELYFGKMLMLHEIILLEYSMELEKKV